MQTERTQKTLLRCLLGLYLFLLTALSLFPEGLHSPKFVSTLDASPSSMREVFGLSDAGSYLGAAIQLESEGYLDPSNNWILNLWPPGMVLLDAFLLQFLPANVPFGVGLAILTGSCWFLLMLAFLLLVQRAWGTMSAFLAASVAFLLTPVPGWVLGYGLFYADGLGLAFFLSFLVFLSLALSRPTAWQSWVSFSILAGVSLAIAAYFRAAYFPIHYAVVCVAIILLVVCVAASFRHMGTSKQIHWAPALSCLVAWLVMASLTLPWLNFSEGKLRDSRTWSVASSGFLVGSWVDRDLAPSFLRGVGWACELDPQRCSELRSLEIQIGGPLPATVYARESLGVVVNSPLEFLHDRSRFFMEAWILGDDDNSRQEMLQGVILLVFFVYTELLAIRLVMRRQFGYLLWLFIPIVLVLPPTIGHFEVRYLMPLKLMCVSAPLLALHLRSLQNVKLDPVRTL